MKVLIVEDNVGERGLLRDAIRPLCAAILEAADGADGFETAVREKPDVIIADAMMCGIGGKDLLRFIRHSSLRSIPFILLSRIKCDPDEQISSNYTYWAYSESREQLAAEVKEILQRIILKEDSPAASLDTFSMSSSCCSSGQQGGAAEMERPRGNHLHQTQKMEALGTLCGGIAHDFNNILTAIIGFSNVLLMKMNDPNLSPLVGNIVAAAERAANLTGSLLAFSRKMRIELRTVDLKTIVNDMQPVVGRLLPPTVALKVDPRSEPLLVMADPGQLGQVLVNLATNSRDAMPGGGEIVITTKRVDMDNDFIRKYGFGSPGSYAMLTLRDTGAGMDEATMERMYEPFFTTKERGKGTGLGLSIVYGVIKQHQGFIICSSTPGSGTVFDMYLPLAP